MSPDHNGERPYIVEIDRAVDRWIMMLAGFLWGVLVGGVAGYWLGAGW